MLLQIDIFTLDMVLDLILVHILSLLYFSLVGTSPALLKGGGVRTFQKLSPLGGGEVPKILLERENNP